MRRTLLAIAALSMLLVPSMSVAQEGDGKPHCDVPEAQQDDACKKQRKGGFQTKFFG